MDQKINLRTKTIKNQIKEFKKTLKVIHSRDELFPTILGSNKRFLNREIRIPVTFHGDFQNCTFNAVVNSGATNSFMTKSLAHYLNLIPELLSKETNIVTFDGRNISVDYKTKFDFNLGAINITRGEFLLLDELPGVSLILGFDFLHEYEPIIDWRDQSITIKSLPRNNHPFIDRKNIGYVFMSQSQRSNSPEFSDKTQEELLQFEEELEAKSVPTEYHNYLDVFSKSKGESLPSHQPYDLQINLIPDSIPPPLRDFIDIFVVVYLDDILIYSNNLSEHTEHVKKVLEALRNNKLFANLDKCFFHTNEVEYFGVNISPQGVFMDPGKVQSITNWPAPTNVKAVQGFLGFANFYRRFISNYSELAVPLYSLLKKDSKFNWSPACQQAFVLLKKNFTSAPILAYFNAVRETTIETDASDYAIGAVFFQKGEDNLNHPIAYISRTLQPAEKNYDVFDKEMLAIFYTLVEWRSWLLSLQQKFTVVTDHKALTYFMSTKNLTRRQVRWAERLSEYDFTVSYRPGKDNNQANALSRREDLYPETGSFADKNPENTRSIFQPHHLLFIKASEEELEEEIPNLDHLTASILKYQKLDPTINTIVDEINSVGKENYSIKENFLLYNDRIVIPDIDDLKLQILHSRHDHPTAGHPGHSKTLQLVRRDFYWQGIKQAVINYVDGCHICKRAKPTRHQPYGLLQPLPIPERPWSSLSMDFIDQLPESKGFDSILVVVDRLTKMAIFIPTYTTINSEQLAVLFIHHVFSKHGLPIDIVSDRGSKFTSKFWRALNTALGIKQKLSTAFHPQTDGQTERVNQVVETYLRLYINYGQNNWSQYLPLAEFAYNNATHSSTTMSPFFANKGYNPTIDISLTGVTEKSHRVAIGDLHKLIEHARSQIKIALATNEKYTNPKRKEPPIYKIGDKAWLSTEHLSTTRPTKKFSERRLRPFEIVQVISKLAIKLKLPSYLNNIHPVFHVSLLEPYKNDMTPGRRQPPPPAVIINDELEYEVGKILDSRVRYKRLEYLVEWLGYEDDDNNRTSWEPAENVAGAKLAVEKFPRESEQRNQPQHQNKPRRSHRRK